MDKIELERFQELRKAILALDDEIENLEAEKREVCSAMDTVQASSNVYPFARRVVSIHGVSSWGKKDLERIALELGQAVSRRKTLRSEYIDEYSKLDKFICGVESITLRRILTMKYIQGMNFVQIAHELGNGYSSDSVRMQLNRYLEKNKQK